MSRPPQPLSVSPFSKVERRILESRPGARLCGPAPASEEEDIGVIEKPMQVNSSPIENDDDWPIKRLLTA